MNYKPELISFKLCPFVQRSVITLLEKKVDFSIQYIDLKNKPDWFLKLSPLGKVPVLRVADEVLFESAVINEYLDEINPPSMHPVTPLQKAKNRSWIEFGSSLLAEQFQMLHAKTEEEFMSKKESFIKKLEMLENHIQAEYFNGDYFSLLDSAFAPLFMRLNILEKKLNDIFIKSDRLKNWRDNLLKRESVRKSVVPEFEELFLEFIKKSGSYIGGKL